MALASAPAWVGRFAWTLLAWAWQRLSWRLVPVPLVAVLSAALCVTLTDRSIWPANGSSAASRQSVSRTCSCSLRSASWSTALEPVWLCAGGGERVSRPGGRLVGDRVRRDLACRASETPSGGRGSAELEASPGFGSAGPRPPETVAALPAIHCDAAGACRRRLARPGGRAAGACAHVERTAGHRRRGESDLRFRTFTASPRC